MTLAVDLADYVLGTIPPHELPEVALRGMLDGHESLSLAALAGVTARTYDRWEVEALLCRALGELGITLPDRENAAQTIIADSVRRVLAGEMLPRAAISRIVNGAHYASGASDHDSEVAGDSLGLGEVIGIYWMYDESDQPWTPSIEELDQQARDALARLEAHRRPTPG